MIRRSIMITSDPGVFYPDVRSLSSPSGLPLFQGLTILTSDLYLPHLGFTRSGASHQDPMISRPDPLSRRSIILIHSLCVLRPDRSLTFSFLSGRSRDI